MNLVLPLADVTPDCRPRVGGKAVALAQLRRHGFNVPDGLCVMADAYNAYIDATGLRERVLLAVNRKRAEDMRWEELWDAALRIRNMFLTTPVPDDWRDRLQRPVAERFADVPVVVRSSSLHEDSAGASFAGLHDSYVNVRGIDAILDHVRLVWASLWSDGALLYRNELGLDTGGPAMAVVIQELVVGESSGVVFSRSPADSDQVVVEAVYGLNQGLVDGTVEPDRWALDRTSGRVISHHAPKRDQAVALADSGVSATALSREQREIPPLRPEGVRRIFDLAHRAETAFGDPQDIEWTIRDGVLHVLQSRPITTAASPDEDDKRPWYLSLKRGFDDLKALRERVEGEIVPGMQAEAARLAAADLTALDETSLAAEIERRSRIQQQWVATYWRDCIPLAHGVRLFGQVYNDALRPSNPYEFLDLLGGTGLVSLERNRALAGLAAMVRQTPNLERELRRRGDAPTGHAPFEEALDAFLERYGDFPSGSTSPHEAREATVRFLLEMAASATADARPSGHDAGELESRFLSRFSDERQSYAHDLLDLARASYRLRDNDNIYLGRIEAQMAAAVAEARRRLEAPVASATGSPGLHRLMAVVAALGQPDRRQSKVIPSSSTESRASARQLVGQPASPGLAVGIARVVQGRAQLFDFKVGEVLVCDALDPNMTFVVPLAAAIIERRGGMLIHGSIIAREYGLPCVTGVPKATVLIRMGDRVTVDGFLGIVTVQERVTDSGRKPAPESAGRFPASSGPAGSV